MYRKVRHLNVHSIQYALNGKCSKYTGTATGTCHSSAAGSWIGAGKHDRPGTRLLLDGK